jgi:hypothetical protein
MPVRSTRFNIAPNAPGRHWIDLQRQVFREPLILSARLTVGVKWSSPFYRQFACEIVTGFATASCCRLSNHSTSQPVHVTLVSQEAADAWHMNF